MNCEGPPQQTFVQRSERIQLISGCIAAHAAHDDDDEIKEKYCSSVRSFSRLCLALSIIFHYVFMEVLILGENKEHFLRPCVSLTAVKTHQSHYISIYIYLFLIFHFMKE